MGFYKRSIKDMIRGLRLRGKNLDRVFHNGMNDASETRNAAAETVAKEKVNPSPGLL